MWAALNAFYGAALLATNGPVDASKAAMEVAIQKTQDARLSPTAILAYSGLYWLHIYRSEPDLADVCAERLRPSSKSDLQDDDDLIADNYNAMALQMRGDQLRAERELEDVVKRQALISLGRFMRIGTDPGLLSRVFLIKAQWLRGKVTTALDHYEAIRAPLEEPEHGLYHCWALNEVLIPLYCSLRDYDRARHACETLRKAVHQQSMTIREVSSEAALHAVNALSGNPNYPALTALRDKMDRNKFRMLIPWIDGIRAQMLGELGRDSEALHVIDQSISFSGQTTANGGCRSCSPSAAVFSGMIKARKDRRARQSPFKRAMIARKSWALLPWPFAMFSEFWSKRHPTGLTAWPSKRDANSWHLTQTTAIPWQKWSGTRSGPDQQGSRPGCRRPLTTTGKSFAAAPETGG